MLHLWVTLEKSFRYRRKQILHLDPPFHFGDRWNKRGICVQLKVSFKIPVAEVFSHYIALILMRIFNVKRCGCVSQCTMYCLRGLFCSLPHKIAFVVTNLLITMKINRECMVTLTNKLYIFSRMCEKSYYTRFILNWLYL